MSGKFITFEGGEGAGKSTQSRLLADRLESVGETVLVTREPGGAPGAEEIRSLLVRGSITRWSPMTETLLHYAARREHLDKAILPSLDAGQWVISDRFCDSTMAYQGYGHELGRETVQQVNDLVIGDFAPDVTLILDLPVELGLRRAMATKAGSEDRYERMDVAFHYRLRMGFLEIAQREPERCVIVDADRTVEEIHQTIFEAVKSRLGMML